jgi:cold shock CspA family protein
MARSQETFSKKEVRNKKEKKRKDKAEKKAKRKSEGRKSGLNDMIAYVDEFGKISSTPPDPEKKILIDAESIELSVPRNKTEDAQDFLKKGVVISYKISQGYGFIREHNSSRNLFFHSSNLLDQVEENSEVVFEIGKGTKGPVAMKVKLFTGKSDVAGKTV